MKQLSSALAAHLAGALTTLATVWKVTRRDGVVLGFTDHDRDLSVGGLVYRAASGYTRTAIDNTAGLEVDNLEVESVFDDAQVSEADVRAGLWDFATVEIALVDWSDPSAGLIKLRKGFLGEVTAEGPVYRAELRGLVETLSQSIGEVYTPDCRADLGDARCGVNLSAITDIGRVEAVATATNDTVTVAASAHVDVTIDPSDDLSLAERTAVSGGELHIGLFALVADGTPRNPFVISTPSGLDAMRDDDQAWYALETDLDMAGWGLWTPIRDFRGGLDGRGHAIKNLDLDHSAAPRMAGLFENLWLGAHVRRLSLEGFVVRAGSSTLYAAPLAATRDGGSNGRFGTVEDVRALDCSVVTDGDRAGGLIGTLDDGGAVRRCFAANRFTGAIGSRVGGVFGQVKTGTIDQDSLFFDTDTAGTTGTVANSEAQPKTTAEMQQAATFAGFDFDGVWHLPASGVYPALRSL